MKLNVYSSTELKSLISAPKLIKSTELKDLDRPGIYLFTYVNSRGEMLFYVGRAGNLRARLLRHKQLMTGVVTTIGTSVKHSRVAVKYASSAKAYVLEALDSTSLGQKDMLAVLERFWILYFWKTYGPKLLLNVEMLPNRQRFEERSRQRMSETQRRIYLEHPERREFMAVKVKRQWQDPAFKAANTRRLQDMRDSGWAPRTNMLTIKLPDGSKHVVRQSFLVELLGLGGRTGGPVRIFSKNTLLADWSVRAEVLAGNALIPLMPRIEQNEAAFSKHPFVVWCLKLKELVGAKWLNISPVTFSSVDGVFKVAKKSDFRRGSTLLHEDGKILKHHRTLYEFAKDKSPLYRS